VGLPWEGHSQMHLLCSAAVFLPARLRRGISATCRLISTRHLGAKRHGLEASSNSAVLATGASLDAIRGANLVRNEIAFGGHDAY
jgi:hypothetical protein